MAEATEAAKTASPAPLDPKIASAVVLPGSLQAASLDALKEAGIVAADASDAVLGNEATGDQGCPTAPLLVFINSRSGGNMGPALYSTLSQIMGTGQVFDLSKAKPGQVLSAVLGRLDLLAQQGNSAAKEARERMRILVAGGDGTVGWILSCLESVQNPPSVGVIPLGTGNDLSRSFGWGPTFSSAAPKAVRARLLEVTQASKCTLDSWSIRIVPSPDVDQTSLKLPYAMAKTESEGTPGVSYEGGFWNYFSMGMDAQVAYGFHHLREEKPWLARGRVANQMIYSGFGCTQGWFCTACSPQPSARCIHMVARVFTKAALSAEWEELTLPTNLRALIVLNLQSYAGGRNLWGAGSSTNEQNGWKVPAVDDGLFEIVGLHGGWHTATAMAKVVGAHRIAQAHALKMELRGEHSKRAYMQIDGEPWKQMLSSESMEPTVVEIQPKPSPSMMLRK